MLSIVKYFVLYFHVFTFLCQNGLSDLPLIFSIAEAIVFWQVNEDSGNRRPIMLEAVDNSSNGPSTSRRGEAESSSIRASVAGKGAGEDSKSTSQEKPSKKAKKDKQDKDSTGNNLL